jgi:putative sporulation protein YtxC
MCKGGTRHLITIQFRDERDAKTIYDRLMHYDKDSDLHIQMIKEPEYLLKIDWCNGNIDCIQNILIPVLTNYTMTVVEGRWMKEMIIRMFYYTDLEEQKQILSIARSILDGEKRDIPFFDEKSGYQSRKQLLEAAFFTFLTESVSFSFESFLQFRLKDYKNFLLEHVGKAIDEYKLEQEYQNFIENLRLYVYEKMPVIDEIHLVHDQTFTFYDEDLKVVNKDRLERIIDQSLAKVEDIDLEATVIAPLISIAPRKITMYSNDLDNGVVQTIQNVFLERALVKPKDEFLKMTVGKASTASNHFDS